MSVITSIIGLQNLTNLTNFEADYNGLTSVNLSNLPNLVDVDISDQNLLGTGPNSLTSVNLSGSTAIEELRLDDSNFSAGIPDISNLEALRILDLDQCNITGSIDVSNFSSLERIDVGGNSELTEVIISSSQPIGADESEVLFSNCALTQTAVDNILVALSENEVTGTYLDISGGTNASPSQVGVDAINVLVEDKNWSLDYNVTATNYTVSNTSSLTRDCEVTPNLGLYSLQSNPLQVVRFYSNADLTSPFLGTTDAFFTFILGSAPTNVYTANINPVTGNVTNIQLCS
jgi:hypothetical protein